MIHSASPQSRPAVIVAWFWSFGTDVCTDGRTLCVKIVITTGRDCGRPCGSIISFFNSVIITPVNARKINNSAYNIQKYEPSIFTKLITEYDHYVTAKYLILHWHMSKIYYTTITITFILHTYIWLYCLCTCERLNSYIVWINVIFHI